MGNINHLLNKTPGLIEINLGSPDFRFKAKRINKLSFFQVERLLRVLPKGIENLGIGGGPLRFKWWRKFVLLLPTLNKNVMLVEKISTIDISRVKFIKTMGIKLFLEIEDLSQIKKVKKFKDDCEIFLISLEKVYKNKRLLDALKESRIPFNIETITWGLSDIESKKAKRFLSLQKKIERRCEIIENKVIGLDLNGNFYPCVALQLPNFELGNIFNDDFDKILKKYHLFKKRIKCQYCCQARSWNKYKTLNQDFLCHQQH